MTKNSTAITIRLPKEVVEELDRLAPPVPREVHLGVSGGRAKFVRDLILQALNMTVEDPHRARAEKAKRKNVQG